MVLDQLGMVCGHVKRLASRYELWQELRSGLKMPERDKVFMRNVYHTNPMNTTVKIPIYNQRRGDRTLWPCINNMIAL